MVPVFVIGPKFSKFIFVLLDEGSTVTLINSHIIDEIGIKTTDTNIILKGIGDLEFSAASNKKVNLIIESLDHQKHSLKNVLVVKNLALPKQEINVTLSNLCKKECGIHVKPYNAAPDMLIGQDHFKLITTRNFREAQSYSFAVSESLLGWSIHGNIFQKSIKQVNMIISDSNNNNNKCNCNNDLKLNELIKFYFEIDSIGINQSRKLNTVYGKLVFFGKLMKKFFRVVKQTRFIDYIS